jgi:ERCC4 domain
MILDIDLTLVNTSPELLVFMKELAIETTIISHQVRNVIQFRKKCVREWCETLEAWKACPLKIIHERFVLVRILGDEFCIMAANNTASHLVSTIRAHFPDKQVILLIEGLEMYQKRKCKLSNKKS